MAEPPAPDRAPSARAERPRDALGRPRPRGAPNALALEDFEALAPAQNLRLGAAHLAAGRAFAAHEAWETAWHQTKGTEGERFFRGLAQAGAGYTHALRGNAHGAAVLLRRAADNLAPFAPVFMETDVTGFTASLLEDSRALEAGHPLGALPDLAFLAAEQG